MLDRIGSPARARRSAPSRAALAGSRDRARLGLDARVGGAGRAAPGRGPRRVLLQRELLRDRLSRGDRAPGAGQTGAVLRRAARLVSPGRVSSELCGGASERALAVAGQGPLPGPGVAQGSRSLALQGRFAASGVQAEQHDRRRVPRRAGPWSVRGGREPGGAMPSRRRGPTARAAARSQVTGPRALTFTDPGPTASPLRAPLPPRNARARVPPRCH